MNHKGKITIGRPQYSSGKECITIHIEDKSSHIAFLDIEMKLDEFARAITGLGYVECEFECRGLKNVGKLYEIKPFTFLMPEHNYSNRKEIAEKETERVTPYGWETYTYFSSQDSFVRKNIEGGDIEVWANTHIYRWVDKDTSDE